MDGTHGLKDLFGSVPVPEEEDVPAPNAPPTSAPGTADTAGARTAPAAPAASTAEGGHGLSGLPGAPAQPSPNQGGTVAIAGVEANAVQGLAPSAPRSLAPQTGATQTGATQNGAPLSCVVVGQRGWDRIRRTVDALALQTEAGSIELIVASPAPLPQAQDRGAFRAVRHVPVPEDASQSEAAAAGLRAAGGELVALIDDYAFPARDWASQVLSHRHERFAALGSALVNANPRSRFSWSNMLIENGAWREGVAGAQGVEVGRLPPRNLVYRRDAIEAVADELPALLAADGALARRLAANDRPLLLEPAARLGVLNPSTLKATLRARYAAGRLAAARESEGAGKPKRIARGLGAPFGALRRYAKDKHRVFAGGDANVSAKQHGGAVRLGYLGEGLGRAAGHLRGPGRAQATRTALVTDRAQTLNKTDRRQFASEGRR